MSRKQNKNCFWKTVLKKRSRICEQKACVHKTTFSEKCKKKKKKKESIHNLWRILGTKLVLLVDFWYNIFKTVFPKLFFFCFLLKAWGCLETCVNCVRKCVMAKIYPMKVFILETFFSKYFSGQFRPFFSSKVWDNITKTVFLN